MVVHESILLVGAAGAYLARRAQRRHDREYSYSNGPTHPDNNNHYGTQPQRTLTYPNYEPTAISCPQYTSQQATSQSSFTVPALQDHYPAHYTPDALGACCREERTAILQVMLLLDLHSAGTIVLTPAQKRRMEQWLAVRTERLGAWRASEARNMW